MTTPWWTLKHVLDRIIAAVLFIGLLPLTCLVALVVLVDDGRPVLFTQQRAGRGRRSFQLIKFRTMRVNWQAGGCSDADGSEQPYTRVGPFLRRFGVDELPQLINVLRGEMSLVGPRPCLPYQAEAMSARQRRRFAVRPGITGWAQVNGRWSLTWSEKVELDLWYIDHWSLWLDAYIIYLSVVTLVSGRGLNGISSEEMEDFE